MSHGNRYVWKMVSGRIVAIWDADKLHNIGLANRALVDVDILRAPRDLSIWESIKMAMTPEGRLKKQVKKLLNEKGAWSYMPVQNGMGVVGIPDFIVCYKGLLIGIETKAPLKNPTTAEQRWKKATPNQQNRITEIRESGGLAEVVDDIAQVEEMLRVANVKAALLHGIHPRGGLFDG